jgi:hypothetical protein
MGASFVSVRQGQIGQYQKHYAKKRPFLSEEPFFLNKSLAMTYFRMGKPQTIIGAERFHF